MNFYFNAGEEDETEAPNGTASPKLPKDWRTYHAQDNLATDERASNELAEEDLMLGQKASQPRTETPQLQPSRSISKMGQVMSQTEGLQTIGRVLERSAQQVSHLFLFLVPRIPPCSAA